MEDGGSNLDLSVAAQLEREKEKVVYVRQLSICDIFARCMLRPRRAACSVYCLFPMRHQTAQEQAAGTPFSDLVCLH